MISEPRRRRAAAAHHLDAARSLRPARRRRRQRAGGRRNGGDVDARLGGRRRGGGDGMALDRGDRDRARRRDDRRFRRDRRRGRSPGPRRRRGRGSRRGWADEVCARAGPAVRSARRARQGPPSIPLSPTRPLRPAPFLKANPGLRRSRATRNPIAAFDAQARPARFRAGDSRSARGKYVDSTNPGEARARPRRRRLKPRRITPPPRAIVGPTKGRVEGNFRRPGGAPRVAASEWSFRAKNRAICARCAL